MPADASLERACAKMVCVGFHGTALSAPMRELIARGVSSAVLFARNLGEPRDIAALCAQIKDAADRPILTCIDHEGGRIVRSRKGFTPIPPMREVGDSGDANRARELGEIMARELRAVNIDMNFAPVVDVDTNPANPVIGDRSFSRDPEVVARLGCAVIDGLQSQGVAACAKHFPGHGDTELDSHLALPSLPHDLARLRKIELPPFEAAIRAGVAAVMTAHVLFRAIDAEFPATMSRPVLHGLLREEFGFDGVIISDDLEMKAIADHFGVETAIVKGAQAGVDLFLVCHSHDRQHAAIDALVRAVKAGDVPRSHVEDAGRRIDSVISRFCKR